MKYFNLIFVVRKGGGVHIWDSDSNIQKVKFTNLQCSRIEVVKEMPQILSQASLF
jgi:hypothetical protein